MTAGDWPGIPELLDRLEDRELRLLSWGVVDGFLSQTDVELAIEEQLAADVRSGERELHTVEAYLDALIDRCLLWRVPAPTPRYRTRLGETLRLLRLLRQLWPPRDESVPYWWRNSAPLVADYRLRVAPRRYPRRSVAVDDAVEMLKDVPAWNSELVDLFARIVRGSKLADFQVRATRSVLGALSNPRASARIVTAGTGSGKTLGFYLPALLDIAATIGEQRVGPHTIALYPRNELLRDQAREALKTVTRLWVVGDVEGRPIRIGVLYGDTPWDATGIVSNRWSRWQAHGKGLECPYFSCPDDSCMGKLVWSERDMRRGNEQLGCVKCGYTTAPGSIALTRTSMVEDPPDILFTSTEMLSQQATSHKLGRMLGWRGWNGTRLLLLDEVHTYVGVHGAQVALMLRRWRHANRRGRSMSPVMVGLSATLRNAGEFFSDLTGVDRSNVEVIAPEENELLPISREYGIVLRGDPVSGTSLLSTTIQTLMLLGRCLDLRPGIFGSVGFAFTDNLDVVNRLYDNLRDAEGALASGRARGKALAELRKPESPQSTARYQDGQSWDLPSRLRRMDRPLQVARTSSQDVGVDVMADIVTATSSLEVGFNDPRVGLVVQHKAPRDQASFLQRRGRAGRQLEMRPITVVVLSDYGRDRVSYQTYERLLDPEIDARSLPVANRFVVKMQATHSLLDWLADRTGRDARALLSPPTTGASDGGVSEVTDLLSRLVDDVDTQRDLAEHLRWALVLSEDEVQAALWEEPRSVMLSVVPTALRRLESRWHALPGDADPGAMARTPLPEFMTQSMFAPLNTPDVELVLPAPVSDTTPALPILQTLREAVPGRVSRRYGYANAKARTWLPVPRDGDRLELTTFVERGHSLGWWATDDGQSCRVVRPLAIRLEEPPPNVADTSNSYPVWKSFFDFDVASLVAVDVPTPSAWTRFVETCGFGLHAAGNPLTVRRMTVGSDGELLLTDGTRKPIHVRYTHDGSPAALGYELDVDAMVISGQLVRDREALIPGFAGSPEWRTLAFKRRVIEDPRLDDIANVFQRQWLCEVVLNAFVSAGLKGEDPQDITRELAAGRWADQLADFLSMAYRTDDVSDSQSGPARVLADLQTLSKHPTVREVVEEHVGLLASETLESSTADLLDRVFVDTLGNAVLAAVEEWFPDADERDLTVDVELNEDTHSYRIIASETAPGGLGHVEALHRRYVSDPRKFWDTVARMCSPTEAEDVDLAMRSVVSQIQGGNTPIADAVHRFRNAEEIVQMDDALSDLLRSWEQVNGPPGHLFVSTLATRLLRPGSTHQIDRVLSDIVNAWIESEMLLGVEIDSRAILFHAVRGTLGVELAPLSSDAVYSLLWLRGHQARNAQLEHWHPFRDNVVVERLVLFLAIQESVVSIDVRDSGWQEDFVSAVQERGRVELTAPYMERRVLAECMRQALITPLESSGLRIYARLVSIRQTNGVMHAQFTIAETQQ